jgi:hypothetical protein
MNTLQNVLSKVLFGLSALVLIMFFGCEPPEDEGQVSNIDIMENATEFTGTFPATSLVSYTLDGTTFKARSFSNQYVIFFKSTISDTVAKAVIESNGAIILEKVPSVGYYLVQIPPFQSSSFISSMGSNNDVDMISPNVAGFPKNSTAIIDNCNYDHGRNVVTALQNCGGSFDYCADATAIDSATQKVMSPMSKVIRNILYVANTNKSGPTLINLSINGGLSDCNFNNLPADSQAMARDSWFIFMQGVLMTIAALPDELRSNLVVTIAAGNENMPIQSMLNTLRERARITEVLSENVLIVTTSRMVDPPANYAPDDLDVAVMNNQLSEDGSSFAAPCALGMLQTVMEEKKITAHQALALMKDASVNNLKREILWSDILPLQEYTTPATTVSFGPYYQQNGPYTCETMFYFDIEPTLYWLNDKGTLIIPTHYYRTASGGEGCIMAGVTEDDKTYQIMLHGSNSAITGTGLENILSGGVNEETGLCGFYNAMVFNGILNSNGTISGQLQLLIEYPVPGYTTMQILDTRTIDLAFTKK